MKEKLLPHYSRITKENDEFIKQLAKKHGVSEALVLRFIINYAKKNNYDIHTK